jgi:capsular polysaccharide biosynthesis protein
MTLLELLELLKRNIKLVVLLPVLCAIVAAGVSYGLMKNTYSATTTLYVLTQNDSSDSSTSSTLSSTLSSSQLVSNDVASLLKSSRVTKGAAASLGLDSLSGVSTSVSSSTSSRVITLTVSSYDPNMSANVANAMAAEVATLAQEVMEVKSVNVVDKAVAPGGPSGPNRPLYVIVGFLAGLFCAVAIVVLRDMLNTKISDPREVEELLGLPVIGQFPAITKE